MQAILPLGLTGSGRGSGHIANFVKPDCTQLWVDGGSLVEVVDLTVPTAPRSLGKFESAASLSDAFKVTHDTELDSTGTLWSVGGGGAAGYRLTADPLAPQLLGTTGAAGSNPSPYNDFILHNSQRRGKTLLVTEEDYIDTDEVPPGGCRGQGKFETWDLSRLNRGTIAPLGTWETELNGMFTGGAVDSKAPVTVNCSSHWFDAKDGVAAVGWYEQGVRFLDYRTPTDIAQVGYYIPANGSTWAAYWSPTDPDRRGRLHRRRLSRRRRAQDLRRRADRQEGQGAGAPGVVRQPGRRLRVVPAAPRLRLHVPAAEARSGHAVGPRVSRRRATRPARRGARGAPRRSGCVPRR